MNDTQTLVASIRAWLAAILLVLLVGGLAGYALGQSNIPEQTCPSVECPDIHIGPCENKCKCECLCNDIVPTPTPSLKGIPKRKNPIPTVPPSNPFNKWWLETGNL